MTEIELELIELAASNARACSDERVSPDDVDTLAAEVRRLKAFMRATAVKWDKFGGPHAAAEHCGSLTGECVCGLNDFEHEALRDSPGTPAEAGGSRVVFLGDGTVR